MKENAKIETIFSRFQNLVSKLRVLEKIYTTVDDVKKIIRNFPIKWRPKITVIPEANNLNAFNWEKLISSLRLNKIELEEYEPKKRKKTLKSKWKKALQAEA